MKIDAEKQWLFDADVNGVAGDSKMAHTIDHLDGTMVQLSMCDFEAVK